MSLKCYIFNIYLYLLNIEHEETSLKVHANKSKIKSEFRNVIAVVQSQDIEFTEMLTMNVMW